MDDGIYPMGADQVGDHRALADITDHERHRLRQGGAEAGRQVVDDDHGLARVVQRVSHPAGVSAAHAPAADDGRDPVPVVPPPGALPTVVTTTQEGSEHLDIPRQHVQMIARPRTCVGSVGGMLKVDADPGEVGLDPDLYPLLASSQTVTGGSNVIGLQDPGLDTLLAAARGPGSDAARLAAYAALQKQLAKGEYLLPLAFADESIVVRDTVVGPSARQVGDPADRFWDVLTWRLAAGR